MAEPIVADAFDGSSTVDDVRNGQRQGLVDAHIARQLLQVEAAVVDVPVWCSCLIFESRRLDGVAAEAPAALEGAASQRAP